MKKTLIFLIIGLFTLTSCKEIKIIKRANPNCGPNEQASNGRCLPQLLVCTGELEEAEGVALAQKEVTPGSQCVVVSCESEYDLFDLRALINEVNQYCSLNPMYCEMGLVEADSVSYVPQEWLEIAEEYPKLCAPKEIPCEDRDVINGVHKWVGIAGPMHFNMMPLQEQVQTQSSEEESPFWMGYTFCQPLTEEDCAEGTQMFQHQIRHRGNGELIDVKSCVSSVTNCNWYLEDENINEATAPFDPQMGEYDYSQCTIQSCVEGFEIIDNTCQQIDPCIIDPQFDPSCPGYDFCMDDPQFDPSCPGYDPCADDPGMCDPCIIDPFLCE